MSKLNKPNKVNVRKVGNTVTNNQRKSTELTAEEKMARIQKIIDSQTFVDEWNNEYVGSKGMDGKDLKSHFDNIQLESGLVIQMFMENPIKLLVKNPDDTVNSLDFGIQQIDYRKRNTDVATWGPTPFPVIDKGVIMSISPALKLWYYEQKEKLAKYDKEAADKFIIPEVGDIVYTSHFLFKEHRYYVDKQDKCKDFVKSQEELRLEQFDFLFKITNYEIESIVKKENKDLLMDKKGAVIIVKEPETNEV